MLLLFTIANHMPDLLTGCCAGTAEKRGEAPQRGLRHRALHYADQVLDTATSHPRV